MGEEYLHLRGDSAPAAARNGMRRWSRALETGNEQRRVRCMHARDEVLEIVDDGASLGGRRVCEILRCGESIVFVLISGLSSLLSDSPGS